jgi:hypothetical protein
VVIVKMMICCLWRVEIPTWRQLDGFRRCHGNHKSILNGRSLGIMKRKLGFKSREICVI